MSTAPGYTVTVFLTVEAEERRQRLRRMLGWPVRRIMEESLLALEEKHAPAAQIVSAQHDAEASPA
jgi:hypothetical protein